MEGGDTGLSYETASKERASIVVRAGLEEGFTFSCRRCALCCSTGPNVTLTVFDVVRLARHLNINPLVFLRVYAKVVIADYIPVVALQGDFKGRCVFLGLDKEAAYCKVYDCRPARCRLYPLKPISPSSTFLELDEKCPGWYKSPASRTLVAPEEYARYATEVKEHYKTLWYRIFEKGEDPVTALYNTIRHVAEQVKNSATE
uniref:YkgJ family cysteine cluster protein n=1 Tax=Fervidicoccus fontis TaxID=683846 RepID=A0A7J3ZJJ5_9CREN